VFLLYISKDVFAWVWRKKNDDVPFKRWLKRLGLVAFFCIGIIIPMKLFPGESDTVFNLLARLIAVINGLVLWFVILWSIIAGWRNKQLVFPSDLVLPKPTGAATLIRAEKALLWTGVLGTAFLIMATVGTIAFPDETVTWWITLTFALFAAMCASMILAYFNMRIVLEDDGFTYRNFRRKTYRVRYDDITRYKVTRQNIIFYANNKRYRFERGLMVGIEDFRKKIECELRERKKDDREL